MPVVLNSGSFTICRYCTTILYHESSTQTLGLDAIYIHSPLYKTDAILSVYRGKL